MSYLGLFELEISKTIAIFEISTLKFVCLKISQKKKKKPKKIPKFSSKNA